MNDPYELHMLSGESSAWDAVKAIEALAKKQGGYTWEPVSPEITVPDRITKMFKKIDKALMGKLLSAKQTDWKVIVPALQKMLPTGVSKEESSILLDVLLVTYAANMGVPIPYVAVG
jgi:hypothetical protein